MVIWIALAALMGVAVSLQGATNGTLAGRVGLAAAVLLNAAVVLAGALLFWWLAPARAAAAPSQWPSAWPLYLGGLYGLFIIGGAAFLFPRLGPGPTVAVMVAVQLLTALVLDHVGWPAATMPVTPVRLLGAVLLVVGAVLVLWPRLSAAD